MRTAIVMWDNNHPDWDNEEYPAPMLRFDTNEVWPFEYVDDQLGIGFWEVPNADGSLGDELEAELTAQYGPRIGAA